MKPLIGISTSLWVESNAKMMEPCKTYNLSKREYSTKIAEQGAVPLLIANIDDENYLGDVLDKIDGLLFSGGNDIDPAFFGQANQFKDSVIHPYRDKTELFLAKAAFKRQIPMLGICRGLQLINVAFGGDLYQDLSLKNNCIKHYGETVEDVVFHDINITPRSHLAKLHNTLLAKVNSTHHQAINKVAEQFSISAQSADGVIEAIEFTGSDNYVLAVQWHLETLKEDSFSENIFADFIRAADNH